MNRALVLLFIVLVPATCAAAEPSGEAVFNRWCVHCHGTEAAMPGRMRLEWNHGKARSVLAERDDLDPAYVRQTVRHGRSEMPSFRITEISEAELNALINYLTAKP